MISEERSGWPEYRQLVDDSVVEKKWPGWNFEDSPLASYGGTFGSLLDQLPGQTGERFRNLEEYLAYVFHGRKKLRVIDFGGLGIALSEDLRIFLDIDDSLGVSLNDPRAWHGKNFDMKRMARKHHTVIVGDMFARKTRYEIERWLKGGRADLIFERIEGGLGHVPRDIRLFREVVKQLYVILAEEGIIFLQVRRREPYLGSILKPRDSQLMASWIQYIQKEYGSKIGVVWNGYSLALRKLKGAPEKLPGTELLRKPTKKSI
jgi:hypothetical protein